MSVNDVLLFNALIVFISFIGVLYHRRRLLRCVMAFLPAFFASGTTLCLIGGSFSQANGGLAGILVFYCGVLCSVFALTACLLFLKKQEAVN